VAKNALKCSHVHLNQWQSQGFESGGLKGDRAGGGLTAPVGDSGAVPPEKFSNYGCMQVF
jgi:hypothetical protein